jgi:hypothetical protein
MAAPTTATLALALGWDAKRQRALWTVREGKAAPRHFGADRCALVK